MCIAKKVLLTYIDGPDNIIFAIEDNLGEPFLKKHPDKDRFWKFPDGSKLDIMLNSYKPRTGKWIHITHTKEWGKIK